MNGAPGTRDSERRSDLPQRGEIEGELLLTVEVEDAVHCLVVEGSHGADAAADLLGGKVEVLAEDMLFTCSRY